MRKVTGMDKFFLHNFRAPLILACFRTSKFDYLTLKDYLIKKTPGHNVKSKVVEMFGSHYYQDLTEQEWKDKRDNYFIKVDGVHTEQAIQLLIEKIFKTSMDIHENVMWRFYLIPDFA